MITVSNNGSAILLEVQVDSIGGQRRFHVELDGNNATLLLLQLIGNIEQLNKTNMPASLHGGRLSDREVAVPAFAKKKVTVEDFLADINSTIQQATVGIKKA